MSLKHAILILPKASRAAATTCSSASRRASATSGTPSISRSTEELKKLSEAGWLDCQAQAQETRPDKKVYRLTPSGHAELLRWLGEPVQPNKINDALLVKLFGGAHTSTANLREEMQRHVAVHRKTLDSLLAIERDYQALPADQRQALRLPYLTLRRGILGEQSWLAWAAEVQAALDAD